jgi:Major tropism determinant N-terminal domain
MANRIQLRRDTASNWTRVNPVLDDGEPGLNIDNNQIKYGDGNTAWNDLDYASGSPDRLVKDSYSVILDEFGSLTLPTEGHIGPTKGGTMLDGGNGYNASLTSFYSSGLYSSCVTANPNGTLNITAYNDGGPDPAKVWTFDADSTLTLPGDIKNGTAGLSFPSGGVYLTTNLDDDNNALYFDPISHDAQLYVGGNITLSTAVVPGDSELDWTFGTDGILTLPPTVGGGNEGAEIDFTKAPNSTLSGSIVVVDQWVDRIRFFEGGGTARGAYIDLKQAAVGVGTLLNNRVSAFVNAGTFVTMDNIKATVTTSGQRGLSLAATTGSFVIRIAGTYATAGTTGGSTAGMTITTTPSTSMFGWDFVGAGDLATYVITDTTNSRAYRITMHIGYLYNDNMISIERLI